MAIGHSTATIRLLIGCMGAIYVCAFASLYTQIPGKYGVIKVNITRMIGYLQVCMGHKD